MMMPLVGAVFEQVPRTLGGFLAWFGGAHGIDFAGFALGQVWVLDKKVHCRSLSSIHILNNHTPTARLMPHPEPWCAPTHAPCSTPMHKLCPGADRLAAKR